MTRPPDLGSLALRVDAERSRRSLSHFIGAAWGQVEQVAYKPNWHIDHMAAHLEAVSRGDIRNLAINVPPGSGKSSTVCVFWPVWEWINNPGLAHLTSSYDIDLTTRDATKTQDLINSEWFRARWGHRFRLNEGEGSREFYTYNPITGAKLGGARWATSMGGRITGKHPDRRIIDDPTKPTDATKDNLEKTKLWWQGTMRSRHRDPATVATVLIMQRLAEDDLSGYLVGEGGWTHLKVPLVYETKEGGYATPYGSDPRTIEGESFWTSHFTADVIATIRKEVKDPGIWSAQYQQDPTPGSGIVFTSAHFTKRWRQMPTSGLWIQSWDMTFKGLASSDFVCGQVWIASAPKFFLVDEYHEQTTFTGACKAIKDLSAKWPMAIGKLIEDKANGPAIINHLTEVEKVYGLVPIKANSDAGSKVLRARATVPLYEAGNVELPEFAPWVLDYIREHTKFPRGKYDDRVDTASQALNWFVAQGSTDYAAAMANAAKLAGVG